MIGAWILLQGLLVIDSSCCCHVWWGLYLLCAFRFWLQGSMWDHVQFNVRGNMHAGIISTIRGKDEKCIVSLETEPKSHNKVMRVERPCWTVVVMLNLPTLFYAIGRPSLFMGLWMSPPNVSKKCAVEQTGWAWIGPTNSLGSSLFLSPLAQVLSAESISSLNVIWFG